MTMKLDFDINLNVFDIVLGALFVAVASTLGYLHGIDQGTEIGINSTEQTVYQSHANHSSCYFLRYCASGWVS